MFDPIAGKDLLIKLARILGDMGIPFFLIQGTALGAYRDKGFCPTEKDIDIGILHEHLLPKVTALMLKLMEENLDVEVFVRPNNIPRTLVVWSNGAKADLVGLIRHKNWRYTFGPYRPWDAERYALVHDAKMMETYDVVDVFGLKLKVPHPIEKYLATEYGRFWRIPQDDSVSRTRVQGFVVQEGLCPPNG